MTSLNFQSRVSVFDANVGVGHRHDRVLPYSDANGVVEEMQRHGVHKALIYHVQGEAISSIWANEALQDWDNEAFQLQWCAGSGNDVLRQLAEYHASKMVKSVRLHSSPLRDEIPFVDWLYGPLLEWLSSEKIPLWVSLADLSPAQIMDTLPKFPELVTVLVGAHYVHSAVLAPMLCKLPNAFLELSRFENLAGIEKLTKQFGAKRLLYGSYFPRYAMGPVLYYLHHVDIDDKDLSAICAGNLERILQGGK